MKKFLIALNCAQKPNRGQAFESDLNKYNTLIREHWLADLVSRIQNGEDSLKEDLPIRCSHYYRFKNNHRAQADMDPESFLFQTCVDIDDACIVETTIAKARELNGQEGLWKDMLLHLEYSARKKLHIDIRIPVGMTIEEAQQAYCEALGVAYDGSCISPERFILITDASQTIYTSEHWYEVLPDEEIKMRREAYLKRGLTIDGRKPKNRPSSSNGRSSTKTATQAELFLDCNKAEVNPCCLRAFDLCMEDAGLTERALQVDGVRHNSLLSIFSNGACRLMPIEQMIAVVRTRTPDYADEKDCQKLILDFYNNYTEMNRPLTRKLREIHAEAYNEEFADDQEEAEEPSAEPTKKRKLNAKTLPPGLREPVSAVPEKMQMNVLCSIMPIAAAYADQVEIEYVDDKRQFLGLMALVIGRQAGGKSCCKDAVEAWMAPLKREAKQARDQEDAIKEKNKLRKSNERAQEMPKLPIRKVPITISCSTLLRRLKYSQGHTLYSFGEELDTLLKTNGAGNWSAKYDVYRYSFDRAEWGQDYNSDQAESGEVNVAYNWTIFGTYGAFNKCFNNENVENGLAGRILMSEMPDTRFSSVPKYKAMTAEQLETVEKAIELLRSKSGFFPTPRLYKAIEKWLEEKRVTAMMAIDESMDELRKRSAVIAYRCAVIFHLLSGKEKESKACVDFMLMMADYTLKNQMHLLSQMMESQQANNAPIAKTISNKSAFDRLPKVFTMDDLRFVKGPNYAESSYRSIISRWGAANLIEEVPAEELGNDKSLHWRKIVA